MNLSSHHEYQWLSQRCRIKRRCTILSFPLGGREKNGADTQHSNVVPMRKGQVALSTEYCSVGFGEVV